MLDMENYKFKSLFSVSFRKKLEEMYNNIIYNKPLKCKKSNNKIRRDTYALIFFKKDI